MIKTMQEIAEEHYNRHSKKELIKELIRCHDIIKSLTKEEIIEETSEPKLIQNCLIGYHMFLNRDSKWKTCTKCGLVRPISDEY